MLDWSYTSLTWPRMMAWSLLFQLLLVVSGVGLACLLMTLVSRSPMRKLYPYLFG